jgi:hypothetical protein
MQRLRYHLIALVLAAATIGPALLGLAAGTTTNALVHPYVHVVSAATVDEQPAKLIASAFRPPCSVPGNDC